MSDLAGGPLGNLANYSVALENGKFVLKVELSDEVLLEAVKKALPDGFIENFVIGLMKKYLASMGG